MGSPYQIHGQGPVYRIGGKIFMVAPCACPCGGSMVWLELKDTALLTPTADWQLVGCACHYDPILRARFENMINPGSAYNAVVHGINSVVADLEEVGAEQEIAEDMKEAIETEQKGMG